MFKYNHIINGVNYLIEVIPADNNKSIVSRDFYISTLPLQEVVGCSPFYIELYSRELQDILLMVSQGAFDHILLNR